VIVSDIEKGAGTKSRWKETGLASALAHASETHQSLGQHKAQHCGQRYNIEMASMESTCEQEDLLLSNHIGILAMLHQC